jgi:hypothetical protein
MSDMAIETAYALDDPSKWQPKRFSWIIEREVQVRESDIEQWEQRIKSLGLSK